MGESTEDAVCDIDLDRCSVFTMKTQRARKTYECQSCGITIAIGDTYARVFMIFEGDASEEKMCGPCHEAMVMFGSAPGHMLLAPSSFPEFLRSCVDEGDADSTWIALHDQLRRRQSTARGAR